MVVKALSKIKNRSGFTLLELVIVSALLLVLSGGVVAGMGQRDRRALANASLQLQAELREVQRRATTEGRRVGVTFEPQHNRYRVVSFAPQRSSPNVYIRNRVNIEFVSTGTLVFNPRGTPSAGFRIILEKNGNTQHLTVSVSGGRVLVHDINQVHY